eukprot:COSAG01_NODE_2_length_63927_cov_1357.611941_8_plen_344_part_00
MVVGYALGNRSGEESDVDILNEDADNAMRISPALRVNLFESGSQKDKLVVPYTIIKVCKQSRALGVRELYFSFTERADRFSSVNALLDLWGFDSFCDYLYAVAELGFLEGLLPTLDASFLTPQELKQLSDIICCFRFSVIADHDKQFFGKAEYKKKLQLRLKNVEWALKLKLPVSLGLFVSSSLSLAFYKRQLDGFYQLYLQYGMINELSIRFETVDLFTTEGKKATLYRDVLAYAQNLFKSDVGISVSYMNQPLSKYKALGIDDLGSVFFHKIQYSQFCDLGLDEFSLVEEAAQINSQLVKRFPLRKEFIKDEKYSKKLGQVFDSYRYRLKKERDRHNKSKK